jgi:diguanylate cyclase (GGDEF)-like protein
LFDIYAAPIVLKGGETTPVSPQEFETQVARPPDRALIERYRLAAAEGIPAVSLIDGATMAALGADLTVVEPAESGEFTYLYYGRAVAEVTGDDFSGRSTAHQAPRPGALAREGFQRALAAGNLTVSLDRAEENGAVHLWARLHMPFRDGAGRPLVVTLHQPAEYTDELLRDILDAAADGILAVKAVRDRKKTITDFEVIALNSPIADYLGADRRALVGARLSVLLPCVREDGAWERHLEVVQSRQCASFESRYTIHGVMRWFRIVSAPLNDGLVISYTDITELKLLNLRLQEQQQRLEEEIQRRLKVEDELWNLAHLDALTGIANRRAMHVRATKSLAEAKMRGSPCAMIVLDIDLFKQINDTFGHAAGDSAIIRVAEIARTGLRSEKDIVARIGGEEFAMLLQDADIKAGLAVAERLRRDFEATRITTSDGKSFGFTVSFGVAASKAGHTYETLLQTADKALYSAKRAGRNQAHAGEMPDAA